MWNKFIFTMKDILYLLMFDQGQNGEVGTPCDGFHPVSFESNFLHLSLLHHASCNLYTSIPTPADMRNYLTKENIITLRAKIALMKLGLILMT